MKRLTTQLISVSKITTSSTSISRNFTTQLTSSSSSSISNSPIQKPYKTHKNPSQNYNTHAPIPPNLPSRQRKINTRLQIEEIFEAAKSAKEMLQVFKVMEGNFDEGDLGLACLKIGLQLNREGEDYQKILSFANRALAVFDNAQNKCTLPIAMTLQLLGSTNCSLKKFNDALGFLNRANDILVKLENDGKYGSKDIKRILLAVQMELANVKNGMGRREGALDNLRKSLEIKEFLMGEDSLDVGNANRDLAEACVANLNFKDGLPYCLKALKIHLGLLWENSVEVAHDRRLLGVIYTGMEEHEKALEVNRLAQKVLKDSGCSSDLLGAEVDAANMHIALGEYEAATNTLKRVFLSMEKDSEDRSLILITMGKALVHQEKFADAKRCFEIACSVLGKTEKSKASEVAEAYMEISRQYETMNESETAISLLKRALALLEKLPQEQHSEGSVSARIGWLLLLNGRAKQAIPYFESAAETLKETFGSKHFGVGHIYNNLGIAYLELEKPESAVQMFTLAKDIMDVSFGPHHVNSIEACQNLAKAYAAMKSYPLAIEFQQKAVDAWESHGRCAADERREARYVLKLLKRGASSKDNPTEALPPVQLSDASRSVQSSQPSRPKGHGHSVEDELREARRLLEKVSPRGALSEDYPTKAPPLPDSSDASRSLQPPEPSSPKQS